MAGPPWGLHSAHFVLPILSSPTISVGLFGELAAKLADLAEAIMRAALHAKINVVIAGAIEVDRIAEALRAAAGEPDTVEQEKLNPSSAIPADHVQAFEMKEPACCPITPKRDIRTGDYFDNDAIAARVLELHDRLGGFIKPT